jgi:hypothetical protein
MGGKYSELVKKNVVLNLGWRKTGDGADCAEKRDGSRAAKHCESPDWLHRAEVSDRCGEREAEAAGRSTETLAADQNVL